MSTANDFHSTLPIDRGHLLYQYTNAAMYQPSPKVSIVCPFVALVQPKASGHLRLQSNNFQDLPLVYSNCYGASNDMSANLQVAMDSQRPHHPFN